MGERGEKEVGKEGVIGMVVVSLVLGFSIAWAVNKLRGGVGL